MVNRYFKLLEFIDSNDDDIADFMPSLACNRRLRALLKDLKKVESVAKALQGEDVSLLDARVWLDGLIAIKSHYARYIGTLSIRIRVCYNIADIFAGLYFLN
jgi:hypothetical protein